MSLKKFKEPSFIAAGAWSGLAAPAVAGGRSTPRPRGTSPCPWWWRH
jgi:hypothetical protein